MAQLVFHPGEGFGLTGLVDQEEVAQLSTIGMGSLVANRQQIAEVVDHFHPELRHQDVLVEVELNADVELGGTDQKFNLLMGRELQKAYGKAPQCILTMPILEGLDGVQKMSKSLNNYIGINDSPKDIFGKLMSISDDLMWRYIDLLSFRNIKEIEQWRQEVEQGRNPIEIKKDFAEEIVARFHDEQAGTDARQGFENQFKKGELPDDIPEVTLTVGVEGMAIANVLKEAGLSSSTSDAMRMIKQGAAKIDGEKITDKSLLIAAGVEGIFQVGKRKFAKITTN